jgi:hypothetical protein
MDHEAFFGELYRAFNARETGTVLARVTPDVDWPNAWEGGRVHGPEGIRGYWTRQWAAIDSVAEFRGVRELDDGRVEVSVHQGIRAADGALTNESDVRHVYTLRDGLVARMDVEEG